MKKIILATLMAATLVAGVAEAKNTREVSYSSDKLKGDKSRSAVKNVYGKIDKLIGACIGGVVQPYTGFSCGGYAVKLSRDKSTKNVVQWKHLKKIQTTGSVGIAFGLFPGLAVPGNVTIGAIASGIKRDMDKQFGFTAEIKDAANKKRMETEKKFKSKQGSN